MPGESPLSCPVCRASYRKETRCSRCGADLEPLMVLVGKAYLVRQAARRALRAGDFARARELALEAEELCATERGRKLRLLCEWLDGRAVAST